MRTQRTRKNAGAERASSSLRRNIEKIERDKADFKILFLRDTDKTQHNLTTTTITLAMLCAHVVPITRRPPSSSSSSSSRLSCCRTTQSMRIISSSSTETNGKEEDKEANSILSNRRSLVLNSSALPLFLGVLFDVGSKAPKPQLGVQEFNGIKSLTLCPPDSVNCLSTAEEMGTSNW